MVQSVENNLVQNNKLNVGVLTPPNALHKPRLYSDRAAEAQFKELSADIYEKQNSEKFENKRNTPLIVKLLLCAAAAVAGWFTFNKAMKW